MEQYKREFNPADESGSDDELQGDDLWVSVLTGLVEKAVNQALRQDAEALRALQAYAGQVIRVKTYQPFSVVYCQLCDEGVSLLHQYDGEVDARVQMPAGKLVMTLLQQDDRAMDHDFEVKILGDQALVEDVLAIFHQYGIWRWVKQLCLEWLPGLADQTVLKDWLRIQAPEWWLAFQALPQVVTDVLTELKHVSETQNALLIELQRMRESQEKRWQSVWPMSVGSLLFMVGVLWLMVELFWRG